jgi:hypothetical protein
MRYRDILRGLQAMWRYRAERYRSIKKTDAKARNLDVRCDGHTGGGGAGAFDAPQAWRAGGEAAFRAKRNGRAGDERWGRKGNWPTRPRRSTTTSMRRHCSLQVKGVVPQLARQGRAISRTKSNQSTHLKPPPSAHPAHTHWPRHAKPRRAR